MDNPLIFFAVIVALLVLAALLPRWVRGSAGAAGRRAERRLADAQLAPILDELATTVVLQAPEPTVREIIDGLVVQQPRRFAMLDGGRYGIRFVEPDDAVIRLHADAEGTRMQVEGFREHLGRPNTAEAWADLRTRAASAAEARGIDAHPGPPLPHRRGDDGSWVRSDESE
ncbi:hypothetical protein FQ142_14990 [Microbacterium sp. ANT_H45B]|uniref:hypothetical protein n=1 Tax=Microbacterium sp. ANT_H45B TaxID=2597346 RepID=UPI0011ED2F28|nr:hypothetical protein [Microbacterium sp. ANT_H45B]KAA0960144.1 hypothetical protein FQ142_14990 [Microbacterium sp. ANT_H45B]